MTSTLRVVNKDRYDEQHFFELQDATLLPLEQSSVRMKPRLLGLQGSSNLAYCMAGRLLHWWDTYPVPSDVPKPYNDNEQYGVSPCWGFAEVLESTLDDLPPGTNIWGFMPTHSRPVDLKLKRSSEIPTHWIEISDHRSKVMPIYNRYIIVKDALTSEFIASAWASAFKSVWECGYVMNRFTFPHKSNDPVIHPFPDFGAKATPEDGDLRSAVVICLGAGGKTSKSFVHQLATNRTSTAGPLGLLEVSSTTNSVLKGLTLHFDHRIVKYADATSRKVLEWIKSLGAERIVMIEMGGRDQMLEKLHNCLRNEVSDKKLDVITVGGEMKVVTAEEYADRGAARAKMNSPQLNTSGIRTEALKVIGEATYFKQMSSEFQHVLESELARNKEGSDQGKVLGITLKVGEGMRGDGFEHGWVNICQGIGGGNEGIAFRV